MRETKAIKSIKREMRWFVNNMANGWYDKPETFSNGMSRIFGYVQGITAIFESQYDNIAGLWENFRTDIYVLRGVYKPEAWKRIPDVFETRIEREEN